MGEGMAIEALKNRLREETRSARADSERLFEMEAELKRLLGVESREEIVPAIRRAMNRLAILQVRAAARSSCGQARQAESPGPESFGRAVSPS